MALIKCPECGNMISDKAEKCPKCGAPRMEQQQDMTQVFPQEPVAPVEQPQPVQNQYPYYEEDDGNRNKWLYGIIGLLVLALLGVGYWAWNSGLLGNNNGKEVVSGLEKDSTMVTSDSQPATLEGTQNFSGSIGPANVEMSIFIDGSDVNGYYHYNSQERGHNMTLQGNMGGGGVVTLTEFSPEGLNSGHLDGVFNGTTLEGSFTNMMNGKQYKVNLSKANSLSKLSPVTKATASEIASNLSLLKSKKSEKPPFISGGLEGSIGEDNNIYDDYSNSAAIFIEDDAVLLDYNPDGYADSNMYSTYEYNYNLILESYDSRTKTLIYNVVDLKGRYVGRMVGKLDRWVNCGEADLYEGIYTDKNGHKLSFNFSTPCE